MIDVAIHTTLEKSYSVSMTFADFKMLFNDHSVYDVPKDAKIVIGGNSFEDDDEIKIYWTEREDQ